MIVAFYSLAIRQVRQIGILEAHETRRAPLPIEGVISIPDEVFKQFMASWNGGGDIDPLQAYVNQQLGTQPINADYAVVLNGLVVKIAHFQDPAFGDLVNTTAEFPGSIAVPTLGVPVAIGAVYNVLTGFTNPAEQILKGAAQTVLA